MTQTQSVCVCVGGGGGGGREKVGVENTFFSEHIDPFILPDGTKLSSLLYADDLVILSQTVTGLQNAINILNNFCNKSKLNVNLKKIKVVVFRKKQRKEQKYKFFLNTNVIDIVNEYTYLGILKNYV